MRRRIASERAGRTSVLVSVERAENWHWYLYYWYLLILIDTSGRSSPFGRRRSKIHGAFWTPSYVTKTIRIVQTGSYKVNKPKVCNKKWKYFWPKMAFKMSQEFPTLDRNFSLDITGSAKCNSAEKSLSGSSRRFRLIVFKTEFSWKGSADRSARARQVHHAVNLPSGHIIIIIIIMDTIMDSSYKTKTQCVSTLQSGTYRLCTRRHVYIHIIINLLSQEWSA